MRRPPKWLAALAALVVLVAVVYLFFVRDSVVAPHLQPIAPAATLGSGKDAVVVSADGTLLRWLKSPEGIHLPALPGDEEPKGDQLKGPMLEQAKVLGAVPLALRRFLAGSRYDEDQGVEVELTSGILVLFGDASQAERKWRAAATVLANPEVTALDYVNVLSPQQPSYSGEGHLLPTEP